MLQQTKFFSAIFPEKFALEPKYLEKKKQGKEYIKITKKKGKIKNNALSISDGIFILNITSNAFFENFHDELTLKLRNSFWGGQVFV